MKLLQYFMLILFFFHGLAAQELVDGVAAYVGDKAILLSELNMMAVQIAMQRKINPQSNPKVWNDIQMEVLDNLIKQNLLLLKAEEDTITVEAEEVDHYLNEQLDYLTNQAGGKEKLEQIYGMNYTELKRTIRKEVEKNLTIEKYRQKWLSKLTLSRKEVEEFYNTYKDSLPGQEETVDISHILKIPEPSEESLKRAYDRASEILNQLRNGADFGEMAMKYSEDIGTKKRGGDLGWAVRGTFVPEFEEVAFKLHPNEISDIVQTQFGFHIIQLLERQGEKIHARHILIQVNTEQSDEERTIRFLDSLRSEIMAGNISFEEAALKYSDDPNVEKDKGRLGEYVVKEFRIPEFMDAIKNVKEGEITPPIRTEYGYHLIRVNKKTSARKLELVNDWDKIYNIARNFKAQQEFEKWVEQLKEQYPIRLLLN